LLLAFIDLPVSFYGDNADPGITQAVVRVEWTNFAVRSAETNPNRVLWTNELYPEENLAQLSYLRRNNGRRNNWSFKQVQFFVVVQLASLNSQLRF